MGGENSVRVVVKISMDNFYHNYLVLKGGAGSMAFPAKGETLPPIIAVGLEIYNEYPGSSGTMARLVRPGLMNEHVRRFETGVRWHFHDLKKRIARCRRVRAAQNSI